jgi:sterol desaturase/sphingolipid hydroxylase (fatty acid hydroxylase superfamily)
MPPFLQYLREDVVILVITMATFTLLGLVAGRLPSLRRDGLRLDFIFYFVQRLFLRATYALLLLPVAALGWSTRTATAPGATGVAAWPLWLQSAVAFLIWELVIYWQHRVLHTRHLWPLHIVQHSSPEVDWLSIFRMHPVEVLVYLLTMPLLLAVGFSVQCVAVIGLFRMFHNSFAHADLPWTLGPLGWIVASPVFHRWHHEREKEAEAKNFASAIALYDLLFGTYYHPPGVWPAHFGVTEPLPASFYGQLAHPFRSWLGRVERSGSA